MASLNDIGRIFGTLGAGIGGYQTGGIGGALLGLGGAMIGGGKSSPTSMPSLPQLPSGFDRPGVQIGGYQVNPAGILPGGAPFVQRLATGSVAASPAIVTKQKRVCPRGWVLAIDGNCYPKAMVPRKYRMWKPDPRPVFSRRDAKAIRRAAAAKTRLVALTKQAGAHASINRPARRQGRAAVVSSSRPAGTSVINVD